MDSPSGTPAGMIFSDVRPLPERHTIIEIGTQSCSQKAPQTGCGAESSVLFQACGAADDQLRRKRDLLFGRFGICKPFQQELCGKLPDVVRPGGQDRDARIDHRGPAHFRGKVPVVIPAQADLPGHFQFLGAHGVDQVKQRDPVRGHNGGRGAVLLAQAQHFFQLGGDGFRIGQIHGVYVLLRISDSRFPQCFQKSVTAHVPRRDFVVRLDKERHPSVSLLDEMMDRGGHRFLAFDIDDVEIVIHDETVREHNRQAAVGKVDQKGIVAVRRVDNQAVHALRDQRTDVFLFLFKAVVAAYDDHVVPFGPQEIAGALDDGGEVRAFDIRDHKPDQPAFL